MMNISIEILLQVIGKLTVEKEMLMKQIDEIAKKQTKEAKDENA